MKKVLALVLLVLVTMPVFCAWRYETQSVKDDFGDVIRKDDYYINGYDYGQYTDKFIYMYFDGSYFLNGYIRFGQEGYKSETFGTAKISLKEENGNVLTYPSSYKIISNGSYWACEISMKSDVVNKLVPVFARNKEMKMSVAYGNDKYNYGTIDCSDFIKNPICIKEGHHFILHDGMGVECSGCHFHIDSVGIGPAGGFIFYDCDADNDTGNKDGLVSSECGWRYLEAAPEDLPEIYVWGNDGKIGTQTGIGTGKVNTKKISARRDGITTAAKACLDYSVNGYDDWFLPSEDELNLMYLNLQKNGIGSFSSFWYWSSSENDGDSGAWVQYFGAMYRPYESRDRRNSVRPCRAFLTL